MLTMAAVLVAVVAAMVFVMRLDDDPTQWQTQWGGAESAPGTPGQQATESVAGRTGAMRAGTE